MQTRRGRKPKSDLPPPAWARRLREAREALALSQARLAEQLRNKIARISQSKVAEWETGQSEPDLAEFAAIGELLKVFPAWLAFGVGPDGRPDQQDPLALAAVERHKHDRFFGFILTTAARMFAEEGMNADLAYLITYTQKISGVTERGADDAATRELIAREIEKDRLRLREDLEAVRKKRL